MDNVFDNFQLQIENGILIKSWFDDPYDTALLELSPMLVQIAHSKAKDVRKELNNLKTKMAS